MTDAIEQLALELYSSAGASPENPPGVITLAKRVLGARAVRTVPAAAISGDAVLARVGTESRIYVRSGLPIEDLTFAVAHELGHWVLDRAGYAGADTEARCDEIAAALVAPRRAFTSAVKAVGQLDLPGLAEAFRTTETCIALRLGETLQIPICVVAPAKCRIRGADFEWPCESELRAIAKKPRPIGIRKTRLRDDPRRTMLRAALA